MDTFNPFGLEYHDRGGGSAAAPTHRTVLGAGSENIDKGDPFQLVAGVAMAYDAGDGVWGVAMYDFPAYSASGTKDSPQTNHPIAIDVDDEDIRFRVQAKLVESEVAVAVAQATTLGFSFDMAGSAGAMYLDVSSSGTDFKVVDIDEEVSEWGDLYPVLIVKCINPHDTDPG